MQAIIESTTFYVTSSNGELEVNAITGEVLSVQQDEGGEGIDDIERFDLDEWRNTYNASPSKQEAIDILDLGYWVKGGSYIEPTYDWRAEFRNPDSYATA